MARVRIITFSISRLLSFHEEVCGKKKQKTLQLGQKVKLRTERASDTVITRVPGAVPTTSA